MTCKDCSNFLKKQKKWNENKIPEVAIIDVAGCSICKTKFEIYENMAQALPPMK